VVGARAEAAIEGVGGEPQDHASSLGLWRTSWAVQALAGEFSFDESDLGGRPSPLTCRHRENQSG